MNPFLSSQIALSSAHFGALALALTSCAEAPSKSCERTLSCADAATVQLAPDCQWPLGALDAGTFSTWEEAPTLTDAGTWLWFGRKVDLTATCTPPPPEAPPNLDASTGDEQPSEDEQGPDATASAPPDSGATPNVAVVPQDAGTTATGSPDANP